MPPVTSAVLRSLRARSVPADDLLDAAAMARTHTGALAGDDAAYRALFDRYGVVRVDTLDELARIQSGLPEELRAARWMVREREAYIARTNEKAREVIADAKQRSDQMVSESYIVQEAVEEANTLVRNAETEARRIRLESEDFAERHLAEAEQVLAELLRYVREARSELHQSAAPGRHQYPDSGTRHSRSLLR